MEEVKEIQTQDTPKVPKKGSSNTTLIILVVVLSVICLGLLSYIGYKEIYPLVVKEIQKQTNTTQEEKKDNTQSEETEQEDTSTKTTSYTGETVSATLPSGWSITEYHDGEGTDMIVSGSTYTGLTGIKIFKDTVEKFYLKAINGIGFTGCPGYAKFADESPSYRAEQEAACDEIGDPFDVVDLSSTTYSEFEWLGRDFRRVNRTYYYDTREGNNYFESPCVPSLVTFEGLSFSDGSEYLYESYSYGAVTTATNEELLVLDTILGSMTLTED